jgi:hypothetical protein
VALIDDGGPEGPSRPRSGLNRRLKPASAASSSHAGRAADAPRCVECRDAGNRELVQSRGVRPSVHALQHAHRVGDRSPAVTPAQKSVRSGDVRAERERGVSPRAAYRPPSRHREPRRPPNHEFRAASRIRQDRRGGRARATCAANPGQTTSQRDRRGRGGRPVGRRAADLSASSSRTSTDQGASERRSRWRGPRPGRPGEDARIGPAAPRAPGRVVAVSRAPGRVGEFVRSSGETCVPSTNAVL